MIYKFIKKNIGTEEDPSYDYGVDIDSILNEELALEFLDWSGWSVIEVQNIIDKTIALTTSEEFDHQVPGSDFLISIDKNEVYFYDWRSEQEQEDFKWTTKKFLEFMEAFKEFLKSEGN